MTALTTTEVAAFTDLDERKVRKDVESGVVPAQTPPRFAERAVVYFLAVASFDFQLGVEDRRRLYERISQALDEGRPRVTLGRGFQLDVRQLKRDFRTKLDQFNAWKKRLVSDPRILGGEIVFPRSRLSVRHIGEMIRRGVSRSEILEDYPYLTDEDLYFARLYAIAYPRLGRPRDQAPTR